MKRVGIRDMQVEASERARETDRQTDKDTQGEGVNERGRN